MERLRILRILDLGDGVERLRILESSRSGRETGKTEDSEILGLNSRSGRDSGKTENSENSRSGKETGKSENSENSRSGTSENSENSRSEF